jgi:nucleoside-diphosphate-sugar epimerase
MKNVLVTGSLGYLGSVLMPYLQQHGFNCTGYDCGFFKDCLLYDAPLGNTVFRDVRDMELSDLKGIDAVVHLAGISNDPFGNLDVAKIYDPTRAYALKLAKLCKQQGIKFIFASSCSVYGKGTDQLVNEDSPTFPQTPYSLNKLQIEHDLSGIAGNGFSPIALRIATAFGTSPRLRFDIVINMLVGMALTRGAIILNSDGTPWRPNVHVLDICKAIRYGIDSSHHSGQLLVVNVGDENNNLQVMQIAKVIQAQLPGCELKFLKENPELEHKGLIRDKKVVKGVDTRTYRVSFAKIRSSFPGFQCDWSVDKGVKDMIEKLKALNLTSDQFHNKNFYRLQKIESLHQAEQLTDDLRWATPELARS